VGFVTTQFGTNADEGEIDLDVEDTRVAVGGPLAGHLPVNVLPRFPASNQVKNILQYLATFPPGTSTNVLTKRLIAAAFSTDYGTFTCSTNSTTGSPYQDCINTIAAFCQDTSLLFSGWSNCHDKVLAVRNVLNANWKNYINSCAKFAGGSPTSVACSDATYRINTKEVYYYYSGGILRTAYIPVSVTNSAAYIWYT
jgi:hypothetical protein